MKVRHIIKYTTIALIVILSALTIFLAYNSYKKIKSKNVVKKEGNQLELTMEEIVKLEPDVIIIGSNNANEAVKKLKEDKVWATLKAVKAGKVYANPMGTFPWDRYSAEEALQILWAAQKFNPEVFKDLNMVEKTRDFYKRFLSYDLSEEDAKRILNAENPAK